MALCVICQKEWPSQHCLVCNREIGKNCMHVIDGKVYCPDHIPGQPAPLKPGEAPRPEYAGLRKAIWTMLFLFVFGAGMLFIINKYAASTESLALPGVGVFIGLFQNLGMIIVGALGFMLMILVVAYLALRHKR